MKILSVFVTIPPEDAAWWRISRIAMALGENGHEVHLVRYCRERNIGLFEAQSNLAPSCSTRAMTVTPWNVHINHLRLAVGGHFDAIYANTHTPCFCSLLGKVTDKPLFFDMHGAVIEELAMIGSKPGRLSSESMRTAKCRLVEFADLRLSDYVVCVSRRMMDYLAQRKVSRRRMVHATNGVDLRFFQPRDSSAKAILRSRFGLPDCRIFGYMGSNDKWQGVESFVRAAQKCEKESNSFFIVVGGPHDEKRGNLLVKSRVPRETLVDYYAACDVLVLPRPLHAATEVAAPTKLAEYAAMGKPILTTNVGDSSDYVREYRCGCVTSTPDEDGLVGGISALSDLPDEELEGMGRNARILAEAEFDWNRIGSNLAGFIGQRIH